MECNRKFAYTAENTLKIIQSLYEKKLTTYPRVDTNFLPNDQYAKVPKILQGLKPYEALTQPILSGGKIRKSAKVFNDKKITDHHAIIPTGVFSYDMSPEEKRVYDLVARRFIAVFYPDCEIANTTVMARIGNEDFKATGKQIIDPAWRVVFGNNTDKQNEENVLPVYEKGEHGPHTPEILYGSRFIEGHGNCRETSGRRRTAGFNERKRNRPPFYPREYHRNVI